MNAAVGVVRTGTVAACTLTRASMLLHAAGAIGGVLVGAHHIGVATAEHTRRDADAVEAGLTNDRNRAADLCAANLSESRLIDAGMREARLPEADLSRANLSGAHLSMASLWGPICMGLTSAEHTCARRICARPPWRALSCRYRGCDASSIASTSACMDHNPTRRAHGCYAYHQVACMRCGLAISGPCC